MRHRRLWFFACFFNALSALCLAPAPLTLLGTPALLLFLWFHNARFAWPILLMTLVSVPIFFCGSLMTTGSVCAYCLHQNIGTHGVFQGNSVRMTKGFYPRPACTAWPDIVRIRRVYARYFPDHEARFKDESSYQI